MAAPAQFHPRNENPDQPHKSDERWALVQRVVHSASLGRSEQLTRLLLYVCRMAINHRASELSEQRIGVDLFGRAPEYDPGVDGIVRSHATRLRHRLKTYFETEGAGEPIVIEIPRGAYVPYFVPRGVAEPESSSVLAQPEAPVAEATHRASVGTVAVGRRWFWPALLFLAVTIAVHIALHLAWSGGWPKEGRSLEQSKIERGFWSTLFPANARTLLVPGDSGLVLYSGATRQDFTLSEYIDGSYRDTQRIAANRGEESPDFLLNLASRRYTSMVDLNLITQLTHLPQWSPERTETVFARDLSAASAQNSNLILIGSRQANPWISLVEPRLNFYLVPNGKGGFDFLNRHPRDHELPVYGPVPDEEHRGLHVVYGQVAYLPNPSGQGMILVLGGLWMSGTQSAGNFVLNRSQFRNWLQSIARKDGSIPPFELLLRTENLGGSAESSTILTSRIATQ